MLLFEHDELFRLAVQQGIDQLNLGDEILASRHGSALLQFPGDPGQVRRSLRCIVPPMFRLAADLRIYDPGYYVSRRPNGRCPLAGQ